MKFQENVKGLTASQLLAGSDPMKFPLNFFEILPDPSRDQPRPLKNLQKAGGNCRGTPESSESRGGQNSGSKSSKNRSPKNGVDEEIGST